MEKIKTTHTYINECRLCSSKKIKKIFDFGFVPLGNNLQNSFEASKSVELYELAVMKCKDCNHFQLSTAVSPNLLYTTNYTYLSGIGSSFVYHIKEYVNWVINETKLKKNSIVIDIGSNDGTCLRYFKNKGNIVCGIDPAQKPAEIANKNGITTINNFFDDKVAKNILCTYGKVDVVTSQNVLAHVDNLINTFENIYKILNFNGYLVFEIGYFKNVLDLGCFDTIYHEHIDYHHANPLVNFLSKIGFDIINICENNIQGGSLRFLLKKTGKGTISKISQKFLTNEKKSILYDSNKIKFWQNSIKLNMIKFKELFKKHKSKNKICFAYGAPTKATLLIKMTGLNENDISFIVDDNKLKVGRFMPQMSINIKSSDDIEYDKSSLIVIFAWNFADDIIKKLKSKFKANVTIIVPLPNLKVVKI